MYINDFHASGAVKTAVQGVKQAETSSEVSIISVCMEPGSGGSSIARMLADRMGCTYYHRALIQAVAKSAGLHENVMKSIEKERFTGVRDFISCLIDDQYLWPGLYLEHLEKVTEEIGEQGRAVIVGRGVNFILPRHRCFSVRVVCPLEMRIANIAEAFGLSTEEAGKRVINREKKRRSFVNQAFGKDISDPTHYDLIVNTAGLRAEQAVDVIEKAFKNRQ